ncbi:uncharacterized protein DUF4276 [Rhizobium sp. PP-F2F-G48]|uniref:DUF4276 family protein n=1 Tax=Rhizobium sp. PP-F2F-G48 TaxID=2135651 RepID=UPI0010452550|nr:DUF4276 family protein [Rhizobium sp. PP-F2F-G48]TCM58801.1 uncharacterized protein DUF4276 [Rhizobium sp. PP-F2F-G48]
MNLIYPIVEGHGEERAAPALIRRALSQKMDVYDVHVFSPYRLPRGKMLQGYEWIGPVMLAQERLKAASTDSNDTLLILAMCDADDDCPVILKQKIDSFIEPLNLDVQFEFVAPDKEYEAWFLAAAPSFAGHPDCREELPNMPLLETIRGAKGYFEKHILRDGRYYSETVDQAKFSSLIDYSLNPEMNCRSLQRFLSVLSRLKN